MRRFVARSLRQCCLLVPLCLNQAWSGPAKHEVPEACRKQDLKVLGTPSFLPPDETAVSFGLSVPQREFRTARDVVLQVWAFNGSADTWSVWSCNDVGSFRSRGFDIYDSSGDRVFSREEVRVRGDCERDPRAAMSEWTIEVCSANAPLPIAAGACITRQDFTFKINLNDLYDLTPGEYVIHLRPKSRRIQDICTLPTDQPAFVPGPDDLHFTIVQP
jgi:hypothetical protein